MVCKNESVCTEQGTSTKHQRFAAEGSSPVKGAKYVGGWMIRCSGANVKGVVQVILSFGTKQ